MAATVSELLRAGASARPAQAEPAGFDAFWAARAEAARAPREVVREDAGFVGAACRYERLRFAASDGAGLTARLVAPSGAQGRPCVVMFHDLDRGPRGWHHLTRFAALGYAVVELEGRPWAKDVTAGWQKGADGLALVQLIDDALVTAAVAAGLPEADPARLIAWGEGAGGAFAVDAAALMPGFVRCCALNPCFCDMRGAWESGAADGFALAGLVRHFRDDDPVAERADALFSALSFADTCSFLARLGCDYLQGTSLMDSVAPPLGQLAAYNRAGSSKRLVTYPKYIHERINDFENRFLSFCAL